MTSEGANPFSRLPGEVRRLIYRELSHLEFQEYEDLHLNGDPTQTRHKLLASPAPHALAQTCSMLREDFLGFWYRCYAFRPYIQHERRLIELNRLQHQNCGDLKTCDGLSWSYMFRSIRAISQNGLFRHSKSLTVEIDTWTTNKNDQVFEYVLVASISRKPGGRDRKWQVDLLPGGGYWVTSMVNGGNYWSKQGRYGRMAQKLASGLIADQDQYGETDDTAPRMGANTEILINKYLAVTPFLLNMLVLTRWQYVTLFYHQRHRHADGQN